MNDAFPSSNPDPTNGDRSGDRSGDRAGDRAGDLNRVLNQDLDRKNLLARQALTVLPKILTLQDRDPHSPTYGCFDRNFWHYRIIDFPSGMAQEFVFPLALAWNTRLTGNLYFENAAVLEWIRAGLDFAAQSAHRDGSCDDYFPHERAAGAAAFSLHACLSAFEITRWEPQSEDEPSQGRPRRAKASHPDLAEFFLRRADWLAKHRESGRLSNHEALIALSLLQACDVLGTDRWRSASAERLARVLSWQDEEGWFDEYGGCDPGYLTLTVGALAEIYERQPSRDLEVALKRAVAFLTSFVHPDGSFGGEYGSRNTYAFFPHGFEMIGAWCPEALWIEDRVTTGLMRNAGACFDDDHLIAHHAWSYLLAHQARARNSTREQTLQHPYARSAEPFASMTLDLPKKGRRNFPNARLLVERHGDTELFMSYGKGGVFKLFRHGRLVVSDTHLSFVVERPGDASRNAVGHLKDDYAIEERPDEIVVRGHLGWAKRTQMTTLRLVVLRVFMALIGRFFPDLVRRILQRLLITGKQRAPFAFQRTFTRFDDRWRVIDEVDSSIWDDVVSAGIGGHQTSIYVVMSRSFQAGQLEPWVDLTDRVRALTRGQRLVVVRWL